MNAQLSPGGIDDRVAIEEIMANLGAERNVDLARYSTWRVGGNADWFLNAQSFDDIAVASVVAKTRQIPLILIGNGSNMLISDKGVRGLVIKLGGSLATITDHGDGTVYVGAGVRLPELAKYFRDTGAGGLEWGFGVPGCVGGAIFMNAGTMDGEIKEIIQTVSIVGTGCKVVEIKTDECAFGYRKSRFQQTDEIIVGALFKILERPYADALAKKSLDYRKNTQPLDLPNCGSVFRNPQGQHAAKLIESCGLKGKKIGDAQVSTMHANFIVNLGNAKASDIRQLMDMCLSEVQRQKGLSMHTEVRMIGEWE